MTFAQKAIVALLVFVCLIGIVSGATQVWTTLAGKSLYEDAVVIGIALLVAIPMWLLFRAYLAPAFDPAVRDALVAFRKRLGLRD